MTYLSFLPIGIPASSRLVFRNIYPQEIPPVPVLTGGHFGFDEKKRRKRFKKELDAEEARRKTLREALFGMPPALREAVTSAPEQAIEAAAQTVTDYRALLARIRDIGEQLSEAADMIEITEIMEITELIAKGEL